MTTSGQQKYVSGHYWYLFHLQNVTSSLQSRRICYSPSLATSKSFLPFVCCILARQLRTTHAIRLLQLPDTAGHGRFSSLSTAYFRGADSHVRRDVNNPAALHALTRWWSEFRTWAPLANEDMEESCLVVVRRSTSSLVRIKLLQYGSGCVAPHRRARSTLGHAIYQQSSNAGGRERLVTRPRRQWIRRR
jgi:Ras family